MRIARWSSVPTTKRRTGFQTMAANTTTASKTQNSGSAKRCITAPAPTGALDRRGQLRRIWRGTGQLLDDAAADIDRDAAHLGQRLLLCGDDAALGFGDLAGQCGRQGALPFGSVGGEPVGGFLDRRLRLGARFRERFLVGSARRLGIGP